MNKLKLIFFIAICISSNIAKAEWVKFEVPEEPSESYFYDNKRIIKNQKSVAVWEKRNLQHFGAVDGTRYKSVLRRLLIDCGTKRYDVTSIQYYSDSDLVGSMKKKEFNDKEFMDIPIDSSVEILAGLVCKK